MPIDFIGSNVQSQSVYIQPDETVYLDFQAVDIREIAEKGLADPNTPGPVRCRLKFIEEKISADDNPVLLIGRLK